MADEPYHQRLIQTRDRAVLDLVQDLESRLARLEEAVAATSRGLQRLEASVADSVSVAAKGMARLEATQAKDLNTLDQRVNAKRLDRQIMALPRWTIARLRGPEPPPLRVAVVCPAYPGGATDYGGEFVRARVVLYERFGLEPTVIVAPNRADEIDVGELDGIRVVRTDADGLAEALAKAAPEAIFVHHMESHLWSTLRSVAEKTPMVVWVHGFEARSWRELAGNLDEGYVNAHLDDLEATDATRRTTMATVFAERGIVKVFVSNFMRGVAEGFAGQAARNARVIPNVVNEEVFPYQPREPESRFRILWVRSFAKRNYANDQSRDAILHLSKHPSFDQMHVTVVGDGRFFQASTAPLANFPNVHINRGFVSQEQLAELHAAHGIMLVPTRWDSQGLTCCEAMSSGLVPVTTRTAAVPEYVPEDAGMLCPPEDALALADAILALQASPSTFLSMSRRAAAAAGVCHIDRTISREAGIVRPQRTVTSRLRSLIDRHG